MAEGPAMRLRWWENLSKDLLVLIFSKLGVADLYASAFVCTSWRHASIEPSLWRNLDFRQWDSSTCCHEIAPLFLAFARLLRFSVACSCGSVEKVWFPDFADENDLLFVAERCPSLCYVYISNGEICPSKFCKAVSKLKFLKGVTMHANLICNEVFHQLSSSCADICELRILAEEMDLKTALVICGHLPSLKKLELNDCRIAQIVLSYFLDELKELEYLDISGCGRVGISIAILEKASRLQVFIWGSVADEGEFSNSWDSDHPSDEVDPFQFDLQFMEWLLKSVSVG